jgi:hypothetical protein
MPDNRRNPTELWSVFDEKYSGWTEGTAKLPFTQLKKSPQSDETMLVTVQKGLVQFARAPMSGSRWSISRKIY